MRSLFLMPLALALLASPHADARSGVGKAVVSTPTSWAVLVRSSALKTFASGGQGSAICPPLPPLRSHPVCPYGLSPGGANSWPVGDWGSGGYYGYANPPQEAQAASEPQVIVIRDDSQDRMTTAEAAPDYGYVMGCHAIPNGFHCDTVTQ